MFSRFLPQETNFFDFFDQHAQLICQATQQFFNLTALETFNFSAESNPIKVLEHEADRLTYLCMEALHKTFITPFDHHDIFRLISRMDDIMDCLDEAFDCLIIYKIQNTTLPLKHFSRLLEEAAKKLEKIVKGLRHLKQANLVREECRQMHLLENEADLVLREALGDLFDKEPDLRLVIKWKDIYDILERAIDYCEDVADIVEGIILEYD